MKAIDLIKTHNPCRDAVKWLADKSPQKAWDICTRGDWMLWFYAKVYPDNINEITLAKGHCANTVRHLMKNERSIKAIDIAIAFGEGKATKQELDAYAYAAADAAAYAAYDAADADADAYAAYAANAAAAYAAYDAADADADAYAAYAAADAAAYAAYDAYDAAAAYAAAYSAAYAYAVAKVKNQKQTADICRKYLHPEFIK